MNTPGNNNNNTNLVPLNTSETTTWYFAITQLQPINVQQQLSITSYTITVTLGCTLYKDCDSCSRDPNCGWCSPTERIEIGMFTWYFSVDYVLKGRCIQGGINTYYSYCTTWSYGSCVTDVTEKSKYIEGLIYGTGSGFVVAVISGLLIFYFFKEIKRREEKRLNFNYENSVGKTSTDNSQKLHDVNINDLLQTAPKQVTYPDESDSESDV